MYPGRENCYFAHETSGLRQNAHGPTCSLSEGPETACGPVGILPKPTGFMGKIAIMGLGPGAVSQPKPTLLYFR
jgi:hypothetical protein